MDYENFAERIKPLYDFDKYRKPKYDTKPVVRISVKKRRDDHTSDNKI